MQAFQYRSNGQDFQVFTLKGEVTHIDSRSQVHINQTAATVLPSSSGVATVLPGHVYSSHTSAQEVWVLADDGTEHCLKLANEHVDVRAGHSVAFQWIGHASGNPIKFENLATKKSRFLADMSEIRRLAGFAPDPMATTWTDKLAGGMVIVLVACGAIGFSLSASAGADLKTASLVAQRACVGQAKSMAGEKVRANADYSVACAFKTDAEVGIAFSLAEDKDRARAQAVMDARKTLQPLVDAAQAHNKKMAIARALAAAAMAALLVGLGSWFKGRVEKRRQAAEGVERFELDTMNALIKASV